MKMSSLESVEEHVLHANDCLWVLKAAAFKVDMDMVVCAVIGGLHPHFLPMATPMLFAGTIKTVPDMSDSVQIVEHYGHCATCCISTARSRR